jgi:hypothetical protein
MACAVQLTPFSDVCAQDPQKCIVMTTTVLSMVPQHL